MPGRALLRTTAVALAAVLAAGGCASTATSSADATATGATGGPSNPGDATTAPVADAGTGTGTGTVTDGETPDGGVKGGGPAGSPSAGGGNDSGDAKSGTKASGPVISFFRVADKPRCPAGTSANPIAGGGVLVEWRVSNVKAVALSIDGPGIYRDDYPSAGSEEFTFPCSGREGDIQKHTYLLTASNAHGKQTKTIVVTAPVHDIPTV
ncbi:hypothetical protein ACIG87_22005 [Micromonospora sp. NPDC051925]|uniref:hypothetical protein n=1 Tax=Micromonospora sp. NPDC051925 TaxID=3364288 RepID=UPI0037C6864B